MTSAANSTRIAQQTLDNVGRGVLAIPTAHTTDQDPPFVVMAKTDAVVNITAMDGSEVTGVVILAGTCCPVRCLQVTEITSGTIFGIY